MFKTKTLISALITFFAITAHATSSLSFGALAEENTAHLATYNLGSDDSGVLLTTGGVQSAQAGNVNATINAWANPVTGLFKSIASVNINGENPVDIAQAYAGFNMTDTLRFSGAASTVNVNFTMNYDTVFSGLGIDAFPVTDQLSHFMHAWSARNVSLSYEAANSNYDPLATCQNLGGEGEYCPPETQQILTVNHSGGKDLFREVAINQGYGVYTNGDEGNGHYTGQVVLSVTLPTNVDISFSYMAINSVECFHLATCSLFSDASHSDYLGLQLADGASFVSANGYQYQGVAAAVPEPETYAMLIAGLALTGLISRRRKS